MNLIEWSDKLSVGVSSIDEQHQELVSIINALHDEMNGNNSSLKLNELMDRLIKYTKTHFSYEERAYSKYNYPDSAAHKEEHDRLNAKVVEIKAKLDTGKGMITYELLFFLRDWLRNHIMEVDKQAGAYLASKGMV